MSEKIKVACLRLRCGVLTIRRVGYKPRFIRGAVEIEKVVKRYNLDLQEGVQVYYYWERNKEHARIDFTKPARIRDYFRC